MNNLVLLAVAVAVATATFSSVTALSVLGFCPHPGMIRFSHPVQYWNFHHPHFRHFKRIESSDTFENGVHDAENVFHLIKSLPNDCYTYVYVILFIYLFIYLFIAFIRMMKSILMNIVTWNRSVN